MSRTDLVADSLVAIKNATLIRDDEVTIPHSELLLGICDIFKNKEYIENYRKVEEGKKSFIKVYLKYNGINSAIKGIKRVSKSSRRVYVSKDKIRFVMGGRGIAVLSTSKGLLTNSDAKKMGIGGEVILYIW